MKATGTYPDTDAYTRTDTDTDTDTGYTFPDFIFSLFPDSSAFRLKGDRDPDPMELRLLSRVLLSLLSSGLSRTFISLLSLVSLVSTVFPVVVGFSIFCLLWTSVFSPTRFINFCQMIALQGKMRKRKNPRRRLKQLVNLKKISMKSSLQGLDLAWFPWAK